MEEASANFKDIVERATMNGDSYVVERDGRTVCRIEPPANDATARLGTLGDLLDDLDRLALRDPTFAEEMQAVAEERPASIPEDRWDS